MAWDFSTDPEFQTKLDWVDEFVRENVQPLDLLWPHDVYKKMTDQQRAVIEPMKQQVKDQELWAAHLGPELGGKGYGQVKLALLNEKLGTAMWGGRVFGTQAPDTGNAEIIAHYGTEQQKKQYLEPLLEGEIVSCFSMTEPQGGADPGEFTTEAVRDGDEWVINGWKFFSSNARYAEFLIVMAVTSADAGAHRGMSMFIVPTSTPGVNIVRNIALSGEDEAEGSHALIHYENVRVPADAILGGEGQAFAVAQTRLGGGRVHHAMRTVGQAQRALDAMAERVLSRRTKGQSLSKFEFVQGDLADCYIAVQSLRMLVMYTAWKIDAVQDYNKVRKEIAAIKVSAPQVMELVARRNVQIHGALGVSADVPFARWMMSGPTLALADGPSEVHKVTLARQLLREYKPVEGLWPSEHIPTRLAAAKKKFLGEE
jgi:acyl-CoA dehydrogenase